MATMLLVRHGQASWFEENYDRLSSVGEAQSRLLGELWAARGVEVTRVFTGPRMRQVRSAELCGEAYAAAIPGARLLLDEPGRSPLAWQGSQVSKVIAEVVERSRAAS